jgi:hypothetical protein
LDAFVATTARAELMKNVELKKALDAHSAWVDRATNVYYARLKSIDRRMCGNDEGLGKSKGKDEGPGKGKDEEAGKGKDVSEGPGKG